MRLADELAHVETVEDLFSLFGLAYDPQVVTVHRLHILKRFGNEVTRIDEIVPVPNDEQLWNHYATALKHAHDHYLAGAPPGEHVFLGVGQGLVKLGARRKG